MKEQTEPLLDADGNEVDELIQEKGMWEGLGRREVTRCVRGE